MSAMLVVLAIGHGRPVYAQTTPPSFDQLGGVLRPGDTLVITDAKGRKTAGRLQAVTPSGLELLTQKTESGRDAAAARFSAGDVSQIRLERHDSLLNGTLIGFAAGAAPGLIFIAGRQRGSDPIQDAGTAAAITLVPGAMAAGIGALIDALFFERRIVYRSPNQRSRLGVSPWLSESRKGFQVSVRF